ncbi:MAG: discoidin domain-containing protein [Kiritimatiellae bacterium]|nr:discoidin domain-containing protein [Kiritimatiellia bacterium]
MRHNHSHTPPRSGHLGQLAVLLAATVALALTACQAPGPSRTSMLPPRELWTTTTNVTTTANAFSPTAAPVETFVAIDLSRPTQLVAAALDWAPESVPSAYSIEVTDDPDTSPWVTVATASHPVPGLQLLTFTPTLAQHIRVHVSSAAVTNPPLLRRFRPIPYAQRPTAVWTLPDGSTLPLPDTTPLFDESPDTPLVAPAIAPGDTLQLDIDLHALFSIGGVRLDWASPKARPAALTLYLSRDGANWIEAGSIDPDAADASDVVIVTRSLPVRHIRLAAMAPSPSSDDAQKAKKSPNASPPDAKTPKQDATAPAADAPSPSDAPPPSAPAASPEKKKGVATAVASTIAEATTKTASATVSVLETAASATVSAAGATVSAIASAPGALVSSVERIVAPAVKPVFAFSLLGLSFRDADAASRPWLLYQASAAHVPPALAPRALLGQQPFWTVALSPATTTGPLLSTEGAFAPSATAPSLWPVAIVGTNAYTPANARSASYSIPAPGVPLPAATWSFPDGLSLALRILPVSTSTPTNPLGRPLILASYEWANASSNPLPVRLAWILRPLRVPAPAAKGGLAFIARLRSSRPAAVSTPDLQELRVNAEPLYATAAPGLKCVAAPFREADITTSLLAPPAMPDTDAANDRSGLASAAWVLDTVIPPLASNRVVIAATPPLFDSDRLLRHLSAPAAPASASTPPEPSGPRLFWRKTAALPQHSSLPSPLATLPGHDASVTATPADGTPADATGPRRHVPPRPAWPPTEDAAEALFDAAYADATFAAYARLGAYAPDIHHPRPLQVQRLQFAYLLQLDADTRLVPDAADRIRLDDDIWRFAALLRAGLVQPAADWLKLLLAAQNPTNGAVPALYAAFPLGFVPASPNTAPGLALGDTDAAPDAPSDTDAAPSRLQDVPAVPAPDAEQAGHNSAHSQLVFACMEFFRFTHDTTFLRAAYPSMRAAMAYLQGLHEAVIPRPPSRLRRLFSSPPDPTPAFGLLPASPSDPDRHPYVHAFWALLGWKELRAAATTLGLDEDAAWADSHYQALRGLLQHSFDLLFQDYPPGRLRLLLASPDPGAPPSPYDAALLVWPVCEPDLLPRHVLLSTLALGYEPFLRAVPLAPLERPGAVTATADAATAAPAPLSRPPRLSLEAIRLLLPLSLSGRADYAREILFTLTDALTPAPWGALPMAYPPGPSPMPYPRAAALYALAVRQILLHEDPATQVLHLLPGCPPDWLQLGDGLSLPSAPTAYGPVSLAASIRGRHFRLTFSGSASPPGGYRLWWPRQLKPLRVRLNSAELAPDAYDELGISLPPSFSGSLVATYDDDFPSSRDF